MSDLRAGATFGLRTLKRAPRARTFMHCISEVPVRGFKRRVQKPESDLHFHFYRPLTEASAT